MVFNFWILLFQVVRSLLLEPLINLAPGSLPLGSSFRFNHVSHSPPIVHHLDIVHHVLPSLADDCGRMKETRWHGDLSHALRALKGDHLSPKKWYFPTKVFLIPQKRSFNHIYLTFSLSNMIYALLSKKCCESHLRTSMGQIAQDAWIGGWGGGVNLIQA